MNLNLWQTSNLYYVMNDEWKSKINSLKIYSYPVNVLRMYDFQCMPQLPDICSLRNELIAFVLSAFFSICKYKMTHFSLMKIKASYKWNNWYSVHKLIIYLGCRWQYKQYQQWRVTVTGMCWKTSHSSTSPLSFLGISNLPGGSRRAAGGSSGLPGWYCWHNKQ